VSSTYPTSRTARNRWIREQRPSVPRPAPDRPWAFLAEQERAENGQVVASSVVFLTNRECPWRCLMCDLWRNTTTRPLPRGAIPRQIDYALERLPDARQIKLYNSGSFFDAAAIPPADYDAIAERVARFDRVIVECHPSLIGDRCWNFQRRLQPTLEVAMGLETANPTVLEKLNKGMTLDSFRRAADALHAHGVALRAFVLVRPPFQDEAGALDWAKRSVDFAFDAGATVVSLIPVRARNGALEALQRLGQFNPPSLSTVEEALDYGVDLRRGRVFADVWDLGRFARCEGCLAKRRDRLERMNLAQRVLPAIACARCGGGRTHPVDA
jgi:hypothetical protein